MNKLLVAVVMTAAVVLAAPGIYGSDSTRGSKSVTISADADGGGMSVSLSRALAMSILEGVVGADLECGAKLDDDFAGLLRELDRGGRGSRAVLRNEDGTLSARRKGRSLRLEFADADDEGVLKVRMPWAVAQCLLGGSATLSARDEGAIELELVGDGGGRFALTVD